MNRNEDAEFYEQQFHFAEGEIADLEKKLAVMKAERDAWKADAKRLAPYVRRDHADYCNTRLHPGLDCDCGWPEALAAHAALVKSK